MTPEDLYWKIRLFEPAYDQVIPENIKRDYEACVEIIQQAKKEWCKFPTEREINKKRKEKIDVYKEAAWNRYSEGFMDAIYWMRNYLNAPEP